MIGALFPGQGSQQVGMGTDLAAEYPEVAALFSEADERLGVPISRIMREGPSDTLMETRNTQPAIYLHSMAVWRLLQKAGLEFGMAAGHSLGEYSAFTAAGAFPLDDGLSLVRFRGTLMFDVGLETPGAMAAIIGLDDEVVDRLVGEVAAEMGRVVQAANYNAPGQLVISGEEEAVLAAMQRLKAAGARRAIRLPVSGAFHSALMQPVAERLQERLGSVPLQDARFPVVANAAARPVIESGEIRRVLAAQLTAPVRWVESIRRMVDAGVTDFVEIGPGNVLKGLVRRIAPKAVCHSAQDCRTLEKTVAALS